MAIVYFVLAYWAVGETVYKNKIRIGRPFDLFLQRLVLGTVFGVVLIPVAIIKKLLTLGG